MHEDNMRTKIIATLIIFFMLPSIICLGQNRDPVSKIDEFASHWHKIGNFHGVVLVAERDKVLFAKGYGYANREWKIPNTPETKHDIGSISKQFTTVMIFQLIEEGKIRLTDRLTDQLPDYRQDTGDKVTIDHLLQQTSGIPCYVRNWRASEAEKENEYPRLLRRHLKSHYLVSQYMSGDLFFEPGSQYRYSNSNHYLLGKIIERITGKSLQENLNERILKPLGLNNSGLYDFEKIIPEMASGYIDVPSEDGKAPYYFHPNLYGTGGMYSTVEDIYHWNRALETDLLVSSALREKLSKPYWEREGRHSYLFDHFSMTMPKSSRTVPYTSFSGACDGFRTDAFRFPETGHIIVIFDNSEQEGFWQMAPGIYKILVGEPCENPLEPASKRLSLIALTGGIDAAIEEYDDIRKNRFDQYDIRSLEYEINNYANNYTKLRRMSSAETLCQLNARLFPDSPGALDSLGQVYALLGKDDLSREAFARSNEIKSLEDELITLIKQKEYEDAEEKIIQIRQKSPDRVVLDSSRIGPLFVEAYNSAMCDHALSICRLWILGNPQAAGPYFSMARVYIKMGKTEEAAACYQKVMELFPGQSAEAAKKEIEKLRKQGSDIPVAVQGREMECVPQNWVMSPNSRRGISS